MRQLHELLWLLTEALSRPSADGLRPELTAAREQVERLTAAPPDELLHLDVADLRRRTAPLLQLISKSERSRFRSSKADRARLDHRNTQSLLARPRLVSRILIRED